MSEQQEQMTEEVKDILHSIDTSLDSTTVSLDKLKDAILDESHPELVEQLMSELDTTYPEGVSLLSLKNSSMLSYLNQVLLIILSQLERLDHDDIKDLRLKVIQNSIIQRVTLERGVKGLENRLNYQLEKMTRLYDRLKEDEIKIVEKSEKEESDEDSEDSEDEDITSYRPDAQSLLASIPKSAKTATTTEKYKPPKISATLPPTQEPKRTAKTRKLQSMEEFLREQGDAPLVEESIGSTILQHGRGGIKTNRDKLREQEIQRYEESNFTRLSDSMIQNKRDRKREKRQQDLNVFGGEDFSIFNNHNRDINESSSRKRKPLTAWDKAKRKRT